jgi:hypothetical protein
MLSQTIYTCEPGQKDALIKRRMEKGGEFVRISFVLLSSSTNMKKERRRRWLNQNIGF